MKVRWYDLVFFLLFLLLAFASGLNVGRNLGHREGVDAALDTFDCMMDREDSRFQPPHMKARCDALGVGK
ncbi:hypothetical protein [Sphingopyxis macrogoltabida]|uniref:Uncharacterized protein n=1 Tax=Sphingopyxis macrogoltabida TaxID=33050 RepID=A0AAC9AXB8_SPHMC|nr:hypothetical protein [Sphingopyxis macrogoltabida]ALJ15334.1 hypothetical protein LH19_20865 [Sphingopyxis macrogoltabida]AMU91585.1 hypothetical protein ATM17_21455 [Sphingopyxis macrogoltabida]